MDSETLFCFKYMKLSMKINASSALKNHKNGRSEPTSTNKMLITYNHRNY